MQPPLKAIVQEIRSLDPFPDVASRVLEISGHDQVIPSELIAVIQIDPGLTAKVLKLCNSAYYGFQREIATLDEAGNLLGVRTLVNLVLTSSANRYFKNYGSATVKTQKELWTRSVTHAVAARLIAEHNHVVDKERAYTAGLLQNIGSLVLDRFFQEGQAHVSAVVAKGFSLIEAEKYALGLHHAELGARLMTRWELPEVLTDTVRFHHAPEKSNIDPALTATIHLAETMTAARMAGDSPSGLAYEVSEAALELTGMDPSDFEAIDLDMKEEMEKARDLLEI
jgi:HD-like signal output (HDOD) protein